MIFHFNEAMHIQTLYKCNIHFQNFQNSFKIAIQVKILSFHRCKNEYLTLKLCLRVVVCKLYTLKQQVCYLLDKPIKQHDRWQHSHCTLQNSIIKFFFIITTQLKLQHIYLTCQSTSTKLHLYTHDMTPIHRLTWALIRVTCLPIIVSSSTFRSTIERSYWVSVTWLHTTTTSHIAGLPVAIITPHTIDCCKSATYTVRQGSVEYDMTFWQP